MHKALTQAEYDQILRARVLGWGLRWTVAFGIVLVLTALVDGLGWLWPATVIIAAVSFVVIVLQTTRMKQHIYEGDKGAEE